MELLKAIILGIIQGITEWLPVSSSGHLVIAQQLIDLEEDNVFFDVMLHFATLLVVLVVFREDIKNIIIAFFKKEPSYHKKLGWLIIIGSIPTAIIGILLKDYFEEMFESLFWVGCMLLITGSLLWSAESKKFEQKKDMKKIDSIFIGIAQGFAIAPGISRSGSTISMARFRGIDRELAAKFSFLLFIPAMIGATIGKMFEVETSEIDALPIIVGMIVAMIVGYFSILLLLKIVRKKKLRYFSFYCWIVGILVIVYSKVWLN